MSVEDRIRDGWVVDIFAEDARRRGATLINFQVGAALEYWASLFENNGPWMKRRQRTVCCLRCQRLMADGPDFYTDCAHNQPKREGAIP